MKKLAVGTIFIQDDDIQRNWLELQLQYLRATTVNFDHFTYLYGHPSGYFSKRSNVIHAASTDPENSTAHIEGLNSLLAHFKFYKDSYDYFLFLDSDAFPFRKNWLNILIEKMGGNKHIAVAIRQENLETRWHSSVLFANQDGLRHLKFDYMDLKDLSGWPEKDVSIPKYQEGLRDNVFPLIRTNQYNIHPHLCGIYYDMFYHHCCGSGRDYNMRSRHYWNIMSPEDIDVFKYTELLMADPNALISKLAGWKPEEYAKI